MSNIRMNLGKDLQFLVIPSNVVSSEQHRLGRSFSFLKRALVCLSIIFFAFTQKAEAQCDVPLIFKNPVLVSGTANTQGARYRFPNFNPALAAGNYAELTITNIPAGLTVVSVDSFSATSGGYNEAWQPAINSTNSAGGHVEWTWAFKTNTGSNTSVCLTISTIDNDGYSGGMEEYAGTNFSGTNAVSYIRWGSQLDSTSTGAWKYGSSKLTTAPYEVLGLDSTNRNFTFESFFGNRNGFSWITGLTGANTSGNCCRIFSMYFEPLLSFNPGNIAQPTPIARCGVSSFSPPTLGGTVAPNTNASGVGTFGYRYQWAYSNTASTYTAATASQWTLMASTTNVNTPPAITRTTYYVRLASVINSTVWRPSNVVVFYLTPSVTATISAGPYCNGFNYQLAASSTSPLLDYSWTGPNGFTSTSATPSLNRVSSVNNGSYTVTATDAGGCSSTATVAATFVACPEVCNNFIDDDNDGFIDEADPDSPCFDPGKTLACDDKLYMVRAASVTTNTLIERLDILAGVPTLTTLFNKPLQLNALGQFNGFLYAMANGGTNLYRIDAYGNVVDLGVVANLPIPDAQWSAGTIGRDGNFYVMEGKEGANHRLYRIPLLPGGINNYVATQILGPAAGEIDLPNNPTDIAMDETGTLYAFSQGGTGANVNDPAYPGGLFTIDLSTGNATRVNATYTYYGASLGSLFVTDEGKIYGYGIINSSSGYPQTNFYEINKATGQVTQVGLGTTAVGRSDGASCPWRITLKRYPSTTCFYPGVTFNWEYAVRNQSGQAFAGVELRDTLDARFFYSFDVVAMTITLRATYGNSVTVALGNFGGGTNNVLTILGLNIPNQISTSLSLQTTIRPSAIFTAPSEVVLQQAWLKNVSTTRGGNEPSDNPLTLGPFSDKTPVTVYIAAQPAINAPSSACLNNPISITANNISGVTYAWNFGVGATPATATTVGPHSVSYATLGAKIVSLVVTSSNGCSAAPATATVNVAAVPSLTLGANPSVCRGTTTANLPYTASVGSPNQYSINFDLTAQGQSFVNVTNATLSGSPIVITVPVGAAAGTYNATLVANNTTAGCSGSPQAIQVTVVAAPTVTTSAIPSVCRGITSTTLPYSALSAGATQYSINFDAAAEAVGFVDRVNVNITTSPITIAVPANALAGTYNATFTVTNPTTGCVSAVRNITVQIIQAVVANAGADVNNCNGSTLTLAANAPAPGNGSWTIIAPANGATLSSTTNPTATVNSLQSGKFVDLVWTIQTGSCISRDTVRVSNFLANSPACNCNNIYSISGANASSYAGNQIRILNTTNGTYSAQFGGNLGVANAFAFGLDTVYKRFYYSDYATATIRYFDSYGNDVSTGVILPTGSPITPYNRGGYNPVDKKMYFVSNDGLRWVTYTPTAIGTGGTTQQLTTLNYLPATAPVISNGGDLVFDTEGNGYILTNDGSFYKIVIVGTTVNIIYLGKINLPTTTLASLAFGSDGKLYIGGTGAPNGATAFFGSNVYSIDLQTLAATKLNNPGLTSSTVDFASCSFPFYNSIIVPTKTYVKYGSAGVNIANGDTLEYLIKVKNTGNISAGYVRMFDAIPVGTSYVLNSTTVNGLSVTDSLGSLRFAVPNGYLINGTTQAWRSGVIAPNDSATIKFKVRVNISCGQVDNTATIYNGLLNQVIYTNTLSVAAADPAIANAGPDQNNCANGSFTMAATTFPAIASGVWTIVGAANGAVVNAPLSGSSLVTGLNLGSSVTLRWTVSSVCSSSSDDVVLTNNYAPTMTLGATPSVCVGTTSTTLPYSATTNSPDQYSIVFSSAAISAGFVNVTNAALISSPIVIAIPAGASAATYNATVTFRNATGCPSTLQNILITVVPLPTVNAGADQTLCSDVFTVTGNTPPSPQTGLWTVVSGVATIASPSTPSTSVTVALGTTAVLRWTVGSTLCSASDNVALTSALAYAGEDQKLCAPPAFIMTAAPLMAGATGTWTVVSGSATIANVNSPTTSVTLAVGTIAVLRWTVTGSCTSSDEVALSNSQAFQADAGPDQAQCNNTFTANGNSVAACAANVAIINGSFELPNQAPNTFDLVNENLVPGWKTTAADNMEEFWGTGFLGVPSHQGNQFVELNANLTSALYQDLCVLPGDSINWSVAHRGRAGIDSMVIRIGIPGGLVTQRKVGTGNSAWVVYTGGYIVPAGQTVTRFQFEAVSTASGGNSVGNFIDDVNITLISRQPIPGVWTLISGTAVITNPTNPTTTVTGVPVGTTAVLRWTSNNGVCSSFDDVSYTNNGLPTIALGTNPSVCEGVTTANLPYSATTFSPNQYSINFDLAAEAKGFVDVVNATLGSSPIVITVPSAAIVGTYNATLTVRNTLTGCVGGSQNITVTINPRPIADAGSAVAICTGNNTTIGTAAIAGNTYVWSPAAGLSATNIAQPTANPTATTTYTVTVTNASGCTATSSVVVTVNARPVAPTVTNLTYCQGVVAPALTATGSGLLWYTVATGGVGSSTAPIPSTVTVGTQNYWVSQTVGCESVRSQITVTIKPLPTVNALSNQTICNATNTTAVNFTGSTIAGTTYNWTNNNTSIGLAANGTGNIAAFAGINTTGVDRVATITVTPNADGCPGTPQTFTITVKPTPTVTPIANQVLCNGFPTTAVNIAGNVPGNTYTWVNNTPSIGLAANGTNTVPSFTAVNNTANPVTASITVTPASNGCVATPQTFFITVNPAPAPLPISSTNSLLFNFGSTTCSNFYAPSISIIGNPYSATPPLLANCNLKPPFSNIFSKFISYNPKDNKIYLADISASPNTKVWVLDVGIQSNITCPPISALPTYTYLNFQPNNFEFDANGDLWSLTGYNSATGVATMSRFNETDGVILASTTIQFPLEANAMAGSFIGSGDIAITPNGRMFATLGDSPSKLYEITNYASGGAATATHLVTLTNNTYGIAYVNGSLEITGTDFGTDCYYFNYDIATNTMGSKKTFQVGQSPIDNTSITPSIGVTKQLIGSTMINANTADLTYEVYVKNTGNVLLNNISLKDNLAAVYGAVNISNVVATFTPGGNPANLILDPAFNGTTAIELFNPGQQLVNPSFVTSNFFAKVQIKLRVTNLNPNTTYLNTAIGTGNVGTFNATCGVGATIVADSSNNGPITMIDPNNNGTSSDVNENIPTPFRPLILTVAKVDVNCDYQFTGSGIATVSGGTAPISYAWNTTPAQNTATATGLTVGTYTVTVTDARGLNATAQVVINATNPTPAAAVSAAPAAICIGNATTLTATGGGTYAWSSGQSVASFSVSPLATTTYTVTVTNASGCSASASQVVTVNPLPTPVIAVAETSCAPNDGKILSGSPVSMTANGGVSYLWSTGESSATINKTPSVSTTYSVTVTNTNGCTGVTTKIITVDIDTDGDCIFNGDDIDDDNDGVLDTDESVCSNPTQIVNNYASISTPSGTPINGTTKNTAISGFTIAHSTTGANVPGVNYAVYTYSSGGVNFDNTIEVAGSGAPTTFRLDFNKPLFNFTLESYDIEEITDIKAYYQGNLVSASSSVIGANIVVNGTQYSSPISGNEENLGNALFFTYGSPVDRIEITKSVLNLFSLHNIKGGCTLLDSDNDGIPNSLDLDSDNDGCSDAYEAGATTNPVANFTFSGPFGTNGLDDSKETALDNGVINYPLTYGNAIDANIKTCCPTASIVATETSCAANDDKVLSGESVTLTASGGTGYLWSTGETTASITKTPSVTTTYTVTVSNVSGCVATGSKTITIVSPTTANITGNNSVCIGATTTLTATGGGTYAWSTGAITASINVTPSVSTTYTVTVTNADGCTATASQVVTVNPAATASISGATTVCLGNSTPLTASGGGTYLWSTNATTAIINVNPIVTTTYTVTVTNTNGCTATASQTVTVNPPPTIVLGSIASVCRGVTTTFMPYTAVINSPVYSINFDLTAEGQGFSDVVNAILPASGVTITVPSGAAVGTYNATFVVKNSLTGCPSVAQNIQVIILARPTANAGAAVTICSGSTTTIGANTVAGNTYSWSPAAGLSSATISNPTANPTATTTYTVTVTNGLSCSATSSVTVTVNPTPVVTLSVIPSICKGAASASLPYNVTAGTPSQYSIVFNAAAITAGFTNVGNASLTTSPISITVPASAIAGTYNATITFRNALTNCVSATQNIVIRIDANVTASVTANPAQCNNGTFVLAGNAPSVGTGVWSVVSPASYNISNISSVTLRTATASNVPAGTPVTLAWTVTNGACSSSSTVVLRNDVLPVANAGADANLCNVTTYTLTPNTPSVGTGVWTVVSGSGAVSGNVLDLTQNVCNPATQATGNLNREIYTGVGGTAIANLTSAATYPNNPNITNLIPQFSSNGYSADNYGTRVRGYIRPTVTGNYTFIVTGDDAIDFFLSTDANPANKARIAYTAAWTSVAEFTKYPTQTSVTISLIAGQNYYTELLHKEASGGDHFQVYWQTPSNSTATIIPGTNLVPFCTPQTTVRWTVTNGTCIATDDVIIINSLPVTSNAGPDQTNCGSTFTMAAALPALGTGVWSIVSGPGVITTPASNITTVTGVTLGSTTVLRWTVTNGACSSFDEVSITNRALTLTAGGNLTVCPGMFIQFFANVNDNVINTNGWNWSGPASFASLVQNPARPNATTAMGGTYTVNYNANRTGCPQVSTTTTISMSTVARATITAKNSGPFCEGSTITLDVDTVNTTPNGIWTWTLPNGTTMTGKSITIPNATTAMNGVYSVQYALSGCDFYSSTVVVVYPNPTAAASNTGPFCYNTNINLFGSGVDPSACTNSTNLVVNGTFNDANAATRGFTSQYNYTSSAGYGNYFITNSPKVIWPSFANACVDHTTGTGNMLIADGSNTANSYVWQQNVTTVEPNKFYKFSVWVNNLYTISYARIRLTVNGQQVGTTLEMNYPVCQWVQVTGYWYSGNSTTADLRIYDDETSGSGNDFALDDITFNCHTFPSTGSKWVWSGPNGYTSDLQNPVLINATPINSGIYSLVHTSVNGCTALATTTLVIVKPNEPISFAGLDKDNCDNSTFVMTALDPTIVVDPNAGAGSGSWRKISGPGSISSLTDYAATVTGVTLDATTVYEWTVVRGTCIAIDTVILRNFRTVTSNAGSNQTLCNTPSFNIAATAPSVGTGVWSVVSGMGTVASTNSVSTTVSGVNPNTTTVLRWTVTNGACNATSDISLTNNGEVTSNAGVDQTQCNNGTFTLAGNTPSVGSGVWSIVGAANGTTITAPTSETTGITGLTAGNSVTLRWTLTNGTCSSTDDVVLTNNAPPTANILGANVICVGASTSLTATGGTTYAWSTTETTASINVTPSVSTTYTVTVTNANGCTSTATRTVTVNPLPTPSITGTNIICNGGSTTLTATGGGTYLWSNGSTATAITVSPTANATYTVTVTSASNCSATASQAVTVNPLPTASITGTSVICRGDNTTLTAAGGGTYLWSTGATTADITVSPTANVTYSVTVTNSNNCTAVANQVITVNQPTTVNAYPNRLLCAGDLLPAINFTGTGTSYTWTNDNTANGLAASGTGNIAAFNVTNAGTTNIVSTITVTPVANGCNGTPMIFTITVKPLPVVPVTPNQVKCAGESSDAMTLNAAGVTYNWTNNNTSIGLSASGSGTIPSFTTVNAGTTPVVATITITPVSNGCTGTPLVVTITVNPRTTASITGTAVICSGASTTLTAAGSGTYLWSTGETTAAITVSPTANVTYTVTVTNGSGCTATASRGVAVNPLPTPSITGTSVICNGASTTLTATGGGTYLWSNGSTAAFINVSPTANATYTVTVTSASNCTATASQAVTVNPTPTASITGTSVICSGTSTTLTAAGVGTYLWSNGATTADITVSPTANTTYTVTVTNASNCTATASRAVTVNPTPSVSAAASAANYCSGTTITLNGTLISGNNTGANWSWAIPDGGAPLTGQNPTRSNSTTAMAGVYTVTFTQANGCSATATATVNVTQQPAVTSGGGNQTLCNTNTFTLNATTPAVGAGQWIWVRQMGATISDINNRNAIVSGVAAGDSAVLVWRVTNGACFANSVNVILKNLPRPTAAINAPVTVACTGTPLTFSANNVASGVTYDWTFGAGSSVATATGANPATVSFSSCAARNVRLIATLNGCKDTAFVNVNTNDTINPVFANRPANLTVECDAIPAAANVTPSDNCGIVRSDYFETTTYACDTATYFNGLNAPVVNSYWNAEGRIGGASSYEMDFHRPSPFAVIGSTADATWHNGIFKKFTYVYNPNAVGANKLTYVLDNDTTNLVLKMDPSNPASGAPFPLDFDALRVTLNSSSANGTMVMDSVYLNGLPLTLPQNAVTGASRNVLATGWKLNQGFVITGKVLMSWTGTKPTQSVLNYNISIGKLTTPCVADDCKQQNYLISRTWMAEDGCGNTVAATQVIKVQDTKAPVLAIPANITLECGAIPLIPTVTAVDNCDATPTITFNGEVTTQTTNGTCTDRNYTLTRSWTVVDNCGNASTRTQIITIIAEPLVDITVDHDAICESGSATLTSTLDCKAGAVQTYQWQQSDDATTWVNVASGGTTPNYTASGLTQTTHFRLLVSQGACIGISDTVTVSVVPTPSVLVTVDNAVICRDGNVTLTATVTGGLGGVEYYWQESTDGIAWASIAGANTNVYTTPALTANRYYRMATKGGEGCNVTSASTLITVVNDPSVSTQPQGFTECTGGTLQLNVTATGGTPLLTYQWQKSDDGLTGWNDIATATGTSYTPNSTITGTFYYRVVVSAAGAGCAAAYSNPATVVIAPDPEVQVTVPTTTVCTDGRVILTANPTGGTGTCTVQWQSKLDTSSTWNDVPGATGNTYQTNALNATSNYRAVMSCSGNGCCN